MKTNTYDHLENLAASKGVVCERARSGRKIELTTPCGGTTAECETVGEALDTLRNDSTFSNLPVQIRTAPVIAPKILTATSFPRHTVASVETRKRDIVVRIADWTRDRDEPAYDVEVYVHGVYDFNESKTFTTRSSGRSKQEARLAAVDFAAKQIAKHL